MILFLCAQDLGYFWLGLIKDKSFVVLEKINNSPEFILKKLDEFIITNNINIDKLDGISIVNGPGSFTASRLSLMIANGMHFAKAIPIFVVENPLKLEPEILIKKNGTGKQSLDYVAPAYDRPPHIT
ncbi:hypothetical protein HYV69_03375 [Candidatus Uhrbacteria bacterium]|nr:hypothetical protein [Candidatus Uhrbacteria bacterium]